MDYNAEYNGTETQAKLQQFWEEAKTEIDVMKTDSNAFKSQDLPLARIKKIMKLDEDVKSMMISAEAPVLFAKAAEIFIREITMRAWMHTERNKRRTLQRNDITMAVSDGDTDQFDFLIDIVPREEMKPATRRVKQEETTSGIPQVNMAQTVQLAAGQGAMPGTNAAAVQPIQYVLQLPYNGNNQMGGQPIQIQVLTPGYQTAQTTNDASQGMQLIQMVQPHMQQAGTLDHSGNAVSLSAQPQTIQIQQQPLMTPHQAQPILVSSSGMSVNEGAMIQSQQEHHPQTIVIKQDEAALEGNPVAVSAQAQQQQQFFTIGGQTIMMQMPALQSVSQASSLDGSTTVNSMPITVTSHNNSVSNAQVNLANIVTTSN